MSFLSRYQYLAEVCLKVDFRHKGSNLEPLNTQPTTLHAHVVETAWTAMYLNGTHREASLMWMDTTSFPSSCGSCWNTFSSLTPSREQALGLASPNNALKLGELRHEEPRGASPQRHVETFCLVWSVDRGHLYEHGRGREEGDSITRT